MGEDSKREKRGGRGGQGSKMLEKEGVTGTDRLCSLGVVKGDGGRARNFGVLLLVPEYECFTREREREREEEETGRKVERAGADIQSFEVMLGHNMLLKRRKKKN